MPSLPTIEHTARSRILRNCVQLFVAQVARKRPRQELRTIGPARKRAKVCPSSQVEGMGKRRKDTPIRVGSISNRCCSGVVQGSISTRKLMIAHTHSMLTSWVIRGTLARLVGLQLVILCLNNGANLPLINMGFTTCGLYQVGVGVCLGGGGGGFGP